MCILILEQNNRNTFFYSEIFDMNNHGTFDNCGLIQYEKHCVRDFHTCYIDTSDCNKVPLPNIHNTVLNIWSFYKSIHW